jgi:hypothetical protein
MGGRNQDWKIPDPGLKCSRIGNSELPKPGTNPTTMSYNASVVKIYNATSSLVRLKNKNIFIYFKNALAYYIQRWRRSCKFQRSQF